MSGQHGFQATDPVPPMAGYDFDADDIDELGLDLCVRVARRIDADGPIVLGEAAVGRLRALLRRGRRPLPAPPAPREGT